MKDGFILIEVLLATAISAILGVVLFLAYYQSNKSSLVVDNFIDTYSKQELLEHQLERDICGVFIPEQAYMKDNPLQYIFMSENKNDIFSLLTFITSNPLSTYDSIKPRIVRVVYRLKESENSADKISYTLTRQESEVLDIKSFEQTKESVIRSYDMIEGIKDFKVEYQKIFFKEGRAEVEKKNTWRSEEEDSSDQKEKERLIKMPDVVIFTVKVWDIHKKRDQHFVIHVPIAVNTITPQHDQEKKGESIKKQEQPPLSGKTSPSLPRPAQQTSPKNLLPTTQKVSSQPRKGVQQKIPRALLVPVVEIQA